MKLEEAIAIIYRCEGSKKGNSGQAEIANSDPKMLQLFVKYLISIGMPKNKIRGRLFLHEGDNIKNETKYWADILGIDEIQFYKPTIKKPSNWGKSKLLHGTCIVRFNSKTLTDKMKFLSDKAFDNLI